MNAKKDDLVDDLQTRSAIVDLENKDFLFFSKKEGWFKKEENIVIAVSLTGALLAVQFLDWKPNWILLGAAFTGIYFQYKFWSNEWKFTAAINIIDINKESIKQIPSKTRCQIAVAMVFMSLWKVFLGVWLIRYLIVFPVNIPSESMLPTLKIRDYVWVMRYPIFMEKPLARGDVVVFDTVTGSQYIKRVIAVGGDLLHINKDAITINGKAENTQNYHIEVSSSERKWHSIPYFMPSGEFQGANYCQKLGNYEMECLLPEGSYFVMGDNRDHSNDSRYIGLIFKNQINGVATHKNLFANINSLFL